MRVPKRALSASPAAIVPDEPIAETKAAGRPAPSASTASAAAAPVTS